MTPLLREGANFNILLFPCLICKVIVERDGGCRPSFFAGDATNGLLPQNGRGVT